MDLGTIVQTNFGILDWCIVIGYLLIIVSFGVYIRKYISNATDFMVAGRGLKTFLAVATMIGTELGLITVMYSAQKGFTGGFAAFHIAFAAAIVTLLVGLSGFIVVPLRRMHVMTIPEFYEKRFGRNVRILGGIILALSGILNMGMFLKAGSLFITCVTGLDDPNQLKIVMTVLLCMVLLYTTLGGMVSVVILDYVQFVILSFSLLAVTVMSIKYLGWNNIIETVQSIKGQAGFNPFSEEGFGFSYIIWMFFAGLVSCAVWQTSVIRACSAESAKIVKKIYILSSIGFLIRFLIPYFFGISAFVFIQQHGTLKEVFFPTDGSIAIDSLKAMPIFLSQIMPAGFIGLITAGMLAAFMSTHDSYLLCWSSVLTQDVVAPWFKNGLSSKTRLLLTRIFIVAIGIFILIWGLWYDLGQDLWDYMMISGAIYSIGGFALLIFGIYWKRASKVGAYLSLICGFLALIGLAPVQRGLGPVFMNQIKLLFGYTKEIPIEQLTERMVAVPGQVPGAMVEIFVDISSATIGLTVLAMAVLFMIVGSILFPDKGPAYNPADHYKE